MGTPRTSGDRDRTGHLLGCLKGSAASGSSTARIHSPQANSEPTQPKRFDPGVCLMNQLRDRLAAANPVPDLRRYTREQVTATVSTILSDAAQADEAVTKHNTDEIPAARQRRRRHRWMVGLFAGLIVVPTAAGAVVGGMHTGMFEPSPPQGKLSSTAVGEL